MPSDASLGLYSKLTDGSSDPDATEARNGLRHMMSLSLTKVADGILSPKLVLSSILNSLGAPSALVGLLVPIREAGALLPQILMAGRLSQMKYRKWFWVGGSLGQGLSAAGIALSALMLEGLAAGLAICGFLAVLALSRAACSVSYKDILGKTIEESRRGTVTGAAGTVASGAVVVFALLLLSGLLQDVTPLAIALLVCAGFWIIAAALFSRIEEEASEPDGDGPAIDLSPLRDDPQFRRFVAVRGALTATALAPPYLVLLGGQDEALTALGALLLASSAASFVSSYVWGRLADRSSRWVLILSGVGGAIAMVVAVLASWAGLTGAVWVLPVILFGLQIAYNGVRQGRSTYLVDMAPEDGRSSYAAVANTLIGTLLLIAGAFGGALSFVGAEAALIGFACLSALGALLAFGLDEVEDS